MVLRVSWWMVAVAGLAGELPAQVNCGTSPQEVFAQCPALAGPTPMLTSDVVIGGAAADDFTVAVSTPVTRLRFWGAYLDNVLNCGPHSDAFTLRLWADAGGQPDGSTPIALPSHTVTRSAAPVAQFDLSGNVLDAYEYVVTFDGGPFTADAGTTYWLEVFNDMTAHPGCRWGWAKATVGGGASAFWFFGSPPWAFPLPSPDDLAFTLLTSATPGIPAVSGWGLAGLGVLLAGVGALVVRRRLG